MTKQMELIKLQEQIAGKRERLAFLIDEAQTAPATKHASLIGDLRAGNNELAGLVDAADALRREITIEQLDRDAVKAIGRTSTRQVLPEGEGLAGPVAGESWGAAVVKASQAEAGMRGIKSFITAGTATVAATVGGPIETPRRAKFLRELMPSEEAPGGHVAYLRQTVRTNRAAVVAPAGVKPTSIYTLTRVDDTTDVIAHLTEPISRQDLDDSAILRQFIDAELQLGLELAIDAEIVSAIVAAGPLLEGDIGSTLDTTRRCLTRLQEREIDPTAWVFHPRDWEQIENEAQTAFASNDNMAPATDAVRRTLHGYPVFLSNAVTENTGFLGDFAGSAKLYRTGPVVIDWSEGHYDTGTDATDFERNLVRFRAETRIAPAILRSFAFVSINLAGTGS